MSMVVYVEGFLFRIVLPPLFSSDVSASVRGFFLRTYCGRPVSRSSSVVALSEGNSSRDRVRGSRLPVLPVGCRTLFPYGYSLWVRSLFTSAGFGCLFMSPCCLGGGSLVEVPLSLLAVSLVRLLFLVRVCRLYPYARQCCQSSNGSVVFYFLSSVL